MYLIVKYSSEIPSNQDQKGSSLPDRRKHKNSWEKDNHFPGSQLQKRPIVCIKDNVFKASFMTTLTFSFHIVPTLKECQSRTLLCKS